MRHLTRLSFDAAYGRLLTRGLVPCGLLLLWFGAEAHPHHVWYN